MKIVHLITRLVYGGAQINTILSAAHQRASGHEVVLATGPETGSEGSSWEMARDLGVPTVVLPDLKRDPDPRADFRAFKQILDLLAAHQPALLHTHTSKAGALGRFAAWRLGIRPVVHTPHGHVFHGYFSPLKTQAFTQLERWLARCTDRIIALTPAERDEHLAMGVGRPEQFLVIPSGVDISRFQVERNPGERTAWQIPVESPLIGCVARLSPIKGVLDCVQAMSDVPEAHLVVAGDGPQRREIQREIDERHLHDRIRLLGHQEDVPQMLRALDLFVVPSRNEGMGRTAVEAMAAGLPVVASRVGGLTDVVHDGVTGVLVPPQNPAALAAGIRQILADPGRAEAMGAAGRQRAQEFSLDLMLQHLDNLYSELWSKTRPQWLDQVA
ncbi:MAG: glycosyltransferase family 4 protein [Candidatus Xenobia bacterium]